MKITFILLLSFLVCAYSAPQEEMKLLTARTVDLGNTLVHAPRFDNCKKNKRNRNKRPRTSPPSTTRRRARAPCPGGGTRPATTTEVSKTTEPKKRSSRGGAPSNSGGPPSGTGSCVSCAVDNFNLVNDYRAQNGLNKLKWNDELARLADGWSKHMYDTRVFSHSDYNYWENIIYGEGLYQWDNVAQGFFDGWRNSPGHDQNMRKDTHECMGIGVYGDGHRLYGTQIFADDCP